MLAVGAIAEHGRLGPTFVFIFIWATIVYDPIACWTWNPKGWARAHGVLDFAGGTPVHISSGSAALAISVFLGKRLGHGTETLAFKPNNSSFIILGTMFLWFGWFGFNGGEMHTYTVMPTPLMTLFSGSTLSATMRAAQACIVTTMAASVSGMTWMLWVSFRYSKHVLSSNAPWHWQVYRDSKKWSVVDFCSGVVSGLVAITPGSGYVPSCK